MITEGVATTLDARSFLQSFVARAYVNTIILAIEIFFNGEDFLTSEQNS